MQLLFACSAHSFFSPARDLPNFRQLRAKTSALVTSPIHYLRPALSLSLSLSLCDTHDKQYSKAFRHEDMT